MTLLLTQLEMYDCVSALREENPHLAICVHICENEIACVRVRFCVCLTVWLGLNIVSMCVVWVCSRGSSDPLGSPCYYWLCLDTNSTLGYEDTPKSLMLNCDKVEQFPLFVLSFLLSFPPPFFYVIIVYDLS